MVLPGGGSMRGFPPVKAFTLTLVTSRTKVYRVQEQYTHATFSPSPKFLHAPYFPHFWNPGNVTAGKVASLLLYSESFPPPPPEIVK